MDRLVDFIESLPVPIWLFYVLAFIAIAFIQTALLWLRGILVFPEIEPLYLISIFWVVVQLVLFHYLRISATLGIDQFRDALSLSEKDFAELRYRFTITSARVGWVALLFGLALVLAGGQGYRDYLGPQMFVGLSALITWPLAVYLPAVLFAFLVRALTTFLMASRLYAGVKDLNMFDLSPLFGISTFSYRMALLTVVMAVVSLITNSPLLTGQTQTGGDIIFFMIFDAIIGLAAFLLPLLGMHRRLVAEKQKLASQNGQQFNKAFQELQRRVSRGQLKNMGDLRSSVAALGEYRDEIKKLSTWPWETGTLRNFITALAVPMTVWLAQQFLLRAVVK